MSFAANADLVDEVFAFVAEGGVLSQPFQAGQVTENTNVIESLHNVQQYQDPDADGAKCFGDFLWSDLVRRDIQITERRIEAFGAERWFREVEPAMVAAKQKMSERLARDLAGVIPDADIAVMVVHFDGALVARLLLGPNDTLAERLFRVYHAFGYPCGWEGCFPDGRLVVFARGCHC